jgi:hypothetical protein
VNVQDAIPQSPGTTDVPVKDPETVARSKTKWTSFFARRTHNNTAGNLISLFWTMLVMITALGNSR